MEKKKKLTGSFAAKVVAFFLLAAVAFLGAFSGLCILLMCEYYGYDYYTEDPEEIFLSECSDEMYRTVYQVRDYLAEGKPGYAEEVCSGTNLDIAVMEWKTGEGEEPPFFTTYDGSYENFLTKDFIVIYTADSFKENPVIGYHKIYAEKEYIFRVYVNLDFPVSDSVSRVYEQCMLLYQNRYYLLWAAGISILVCVNCFLFLMCGAGRRNGAEGIQPTVFHNIPLDLVTFIFGAGALVILIVTGTFAGSNLVGLIFAGAGAAVLAVWLTFFFRELAVRMKLGGWWRNTLIYMAIQAFKRVCRFLWKGVCEMFRSFPLILNTMIVFFGICILEFIGVCLFVRSGGVFLWLLEKIVLFPAVVYGALMCKRLLKGSAALAEGRQDEIVDTSHMFGDFKECGKNLNSIGQGISKAVAERMKSEHLKTELITNVSHDLKTPLTSIINYANLIAEEPTENEKITEYSEVLVRQSGRLKKLLEDLVEASKATTGNLEVNLQPCEVGVMLSQAVGEYQQRMEEKQLELIICQPEESLKIMADGRHLWRIFDNLLNNICKYAREDSRVYLSVEQRENRVFIIFRNMSKYALNISPEELQERFVRGDKSRHMEGNGLGLSIAKSLTDIQNGQMEIVTDGDLFKVTLSFARMGTE